MTDCRRETQRARRHAFERRKALSFGGSVSGAMVPCPVLYAARHGPDQSLHCTQNPTPKPKLFAFKQFPLLQGRRISNNGALQETHAAGVSHGSSEVTPVEGVRTARLLPVSDALKSVRPSKDHSRHANHGLITEARQRVSCTKLLDARLTIALERSAALSTITPSNRTPAAPSLPNYGISRGSCAAELYGTVESRFEHTAGKDGFPRGVEQARMRHESPTPKRRKRISPRPWTGEPGRLAGLTPGGGERHRALRSSGLSRTPKYCTVSVRQPPRDESAVGAAPCS